jgi:ketosteroid isomerase-like protein
MSIRQITSIILILTLISCQHDNQSIDDKEFTTLLNQLADAWTNQNTDLAVACFTQDAIYMQPPEEQFYEGHKQLRPFFAALKKGTVMKFHNLWFDKEKQMGAGEFTFGNSESKNGVTGVAIVTIRNGKIRTWREYFIRGPIDFISTDNKNWKWTIENYP